MQIQTYKNGGFKPREAAASIAVDALILAINHPSYYHLEHETPAYRRALLKAVEKLALKLMDQHGLDGVVPSPNRNE